nr:MAG TPA: hypothetical protein [Caudoviricetes sp.]
MVFLIPCLIFLSPSAFNPAVSVQFLLNML